MGCDGRKKGREETPFSWFLVWRTYGRELSIPNQFGVFNDLCPMCVTICGLYVVWDWAGLEDTAA